MQTSRRESEDRLNEMARRYGEVARLLVDTGLIVVSTTNPFGMAYVEAAQTIRTLVHPVPVIAIHMSKAPEEVPPEYGYRAVRPDRFRCGHPADS